jgi:hypothetical protein
MLSLSLRGAQHQVVKLYTKLSNIKHFTSYIFLLGFIIDFVTLPSPDTSASWIIGMVYMLLVGMAIIAREYYSIRSISPKRETYAGYAFFATAFFMGSFLSFIFVYYFRSSDIIASLPIILGLFVFVILNELINTRKIRLLFDISLYFLGSFFFIIFLVPIFVGTVSDKAFILSAVITILYFTSYFYTLSYINKVKLKVYRREMLICTSILLFVIFLFVAKILPAVPLSLKSSGVYKSVIKTGNNYLAISEDKNLYNKIFNPRTYSISNADDLYYYSSVHAPTSISTRLSHTWERYDKKSDNWISSPKITYNIAGGRAGGYRAYTYKDNLDEGKWRVTVRSEDDRVIGRYTFKVKVVEEKSLKYEEVKL